SIAIINSWKTMTRIVKMKLKNKIAIVTGAASGIGKEIALVYAKEGARIRVFIGGTNLRIELISQFFIGQMNLGIIINYPFQEQK
ncbi:SDR family NAD(P)-dependent oxidoreductase, partial [Legionella pneumophila]